MADSWEDEEFDVPSVVPPTSAPVSWVDEVRGLFEGYVCTHEVEGFFFFSLSCTHIILNQ